jgi:hypothetical protein
MNEDLENRLRAVLGRANLPEAPLALRDTRRIVGEHPQSHARLRTSTPAILVAVGLVAVIVAVYQPRPNITDTAVGSSGPDETTSSRQVDGLEVRSVVQLMTDRSSGRATSGPHALSGFWSRTRRLDATCLPPSDGRAGVLEYRCREGEWGITQEDEVVLEFRRTGLGRTISIRADGPYIQPWFATDEVRRTLWTVEQDWTPVPVVVVGHFDDPLASECRVSMRLECQDRFVIDRIVELEPELVPRPTPRPTSTSFPVNDPPPPPFAEDAWNGSCFEEAPKSFEGWRKLSDLGISIKAGWDPGTYVYAIVTRDVVPIGDPTITGEDTWHESPDYPGHKIRWWGQQVCLTEDPWTVYTASIIGTTYIEVDDGRRIDADYPF